MPLPPPPRPRCIDSRHSPVMTDENKTPGVHKYTCPACNAVAVWVIPTPP